MRVDIRVCNTRIVWFLWAPPAWIPSPDEPAVIRSSHPALSNTANMLLQISPGPMLSHNLQLKCQISARRWHFLKSRSAGNTHYPGNGQFLISKMGKRISAQ